MVIVCFKTKKPIVYNKGTKYEKSCQHFFHHYSQKNRKETQKDVDKINASRSKENKTWYGKWINWNVIDYFYVEEKK